MVENEGDLNVRRITQRTFKMTLTIPARSYYDCRRIDLSAISFFRNAPQTGSSPINQPVMNSMGYGDPEENPVGPGADTRQQLYHISQQSQQLHDMLADTEELSAAVATKIAKAAQILEAAFKTITYDKGPGQGQLGE